MRQRLLLAGFVLLVSMFLTSPTARADGPITGQAFPYQAGFPRTDPRGVIYLVSPSVVDINNDGNLDVLTADGSGCVWAWDHRGKVLPGFPWSTSGSSCSGLRINGPLAIGDIDNDCILEVVAGTRGTGISAGQRGKVYVWKANGSIMPGWPREMDWRPGSEGGAEVMTVALANVAGDGSLEILAGTTNDHANVYAWHANGSLVSGYPALPTQLAGIWGLVGAADITGDDRSEVITGRDQIYVHAYGGNGRYLPGWPVLTYVDETRVKWGTDPYMEFTWAAPAMGDLDGNGQVEIVIAGKVRDPLQNHIDTNAALLVLEPNGNRRPGWQVARLGKAPLAKDFRPPQAPALADLDGNGDLEIVVAFIDGWIRAYHDNGTLMWEYDYAQGRRLFGSEPAIGDVTGDGKPDVIFGLYTPDGTDRASVGLMGLDATGRPLPNFPLPLTHEGNSMQGVRAGPTLADLDKDGDVEILAASQGGTLYVWDLPAPYNPRFMPWPTSRHDNYRTGAVGGGERILLSPTDLSASDLPYKIYLPVIKRCG